MADRRILIIAGPNGAGKTTFAQEFLPQEARIGIFINADLIAARLSPSRPEAASMRAGRLMLSEIADNVAHGRSFAFETTLAGRAYARRIPQWQAAGYRVELYFLRLPSAELAVARVAARVAQGGHHITEATVQRRFRKGLYNLEHLYKQLVDVWMLYDNSGALPQLQDWGQK